MLGALGGIKIIASVLLVSAGVGFDLFAKKIPNRLIISGLALSVIILWLTDGKAGLWPALASLVTAFVFCFPLYALKAIAAGDVKLLMVLSLLLDWHLSATMILASMLWGSVLGLARVIISGQLKNFLTNLLLILKRVAPDRSSMQKIPYSVGIFLGLATALSLQSAGVLWL